MTAGAGSGGGAAAAAPAAPMVAGIVVSERLLPLLYEHQQRLDHARGIVLQALLAAHEDGAPLGPVLEECLRDDALWKEAKLQGLALELWKDVDLALKGLLPTEPPQSNPAADLPASPREQADGDDDDDGKSSRSGGRTSRSRHGSRALTYLPAPVETASLLEAVRARRSWMNSAQYTLSVTIGMDFGTTSSSVGIWKEGAGVKKRLTPTQIVENAQGKPRTANFVRYHGREVLVGDAALAWAHRDPKNTIFNMKRLIGRRFDDPLLQQDLKLLPFSVVAGQQGQPLIVVERQPGCSEQLSVEQVVSEVMSQLKRDAVAALGTNTYDTIKVVLAVPAGFSRHQRQALRDAAQLAGLEVERCVDKPCAAAMAYDMLLQNNRLAPKDEHHMLLLHLGGGVCGAALVCIDEGIAEVVATAGDAHLGGVDFDERLISYVAEEMVRHHKYDPRSSPHDLQRLRLACWQAKHLLSSEMAATVELGRLSTGSSFAMTISRLRFDTLCGDLYQRVLDVVATCLERGGRSEAWIHDVVLVGGSSHIPALQTQLEDLLPSQELKLGPNPERTPVCGTVIMAAILSGIGVDRVRDLLLLDVTPKSLGLRLARGAMHTLLRHNTTLPTRVEQEFTTALPYQTRILLEVYEGESEQVALNILLLRAEVDLSPPAPGSGPRVLKISFDMSCGESNAYGKQFQVHINEVNTGRRQVLEVPPSCSDQPAGAEYEHLLPVWVPTAEQ